jgi:hypothetical protein
VSRDLLPPAASLVVFRGAAGRTVLVLSSSSGLLFSRDLGERWLPARNPPAGTPIALYGSPFPSPILVTSAGTFRVTDDEEAFTPIGGPPAPLAAELLSDAAGGPLLEVRSSEGAARWNGQTWSGRRTGVLKGGIFLGEGGGGTAGSYSSLQEVGGKLIWEEGGRRLSVSSPRAGLALATAAPAPGGRLYVGTTGDGLFLFEP